MKILQCHIENFGKWSDKTFDFSDGCNVFCEENGWGKSTLAAFIRVMLYGFANERKKDELSNERKKYMPWQGGVYGGQLVFEADGTVYEISRIFGKKEKDDVFDVRYVETNKKCSKFTSNLGEELFRIDQQSFLKTVFLSQNDCETQITDGMNAKIGNLEFQKDDMSNYESANERLTDVINKMSPTRKTGSLYKMSETIGALSMRVRQKSLIEQSIDKLFGYRAEEKEKLNCLEREKTVWLEQQKERAAQNDLLAKKREYESYCKNYRQRMEKYQQVRNYFPVSLPRNSELEGFVKASSRMLEEKRIAQIYQLTDKEQELLQEFEGKYWGDSLEESDDENLDQKGDMSDKLFSYGIISGIVLAVLGFLGLVAQQSFGFFFLVAGLGLCAGILFFRKYNMKKDFSEITEESDAQDVMQEEIKRMELERYNQLQEKERLYENARKKYMTMNQEISSYIKSLGFVPREDLQEQLQEMKEHFLECKSAYQEYKSAKEQKESFEENCAEIELILQWKDVREDVQGNLAVNSEKYSGRELHQKIHEDLQTGSETADDERLHQILEEIDLCKVEISKIDVQLEQLLEQKDAILESEMELEKQQELYLESMKKYEDLKKVQEYLQKAKESFSTKYAGPIKEGFDKYYRMLTGKDASEYKMDVNSNLTATVYGMQRDSRLFSQGYRDLMGLCMRMAFVEAMYQREKPFLILDDPFVNLDEEKTQKGLALLAQIGQEYQVIYFTCHQSRTAILSPFFT